jgi:hypothetical protein
MPSRLPVVFVFDLDETMIGVSTPLSSVTSFYEYLYNAVKMKKVDVAGKKIRKKALADVMTKEMLRPGFKDAITQIKAMFPTAEFFVYSAGTGPYVADMIRWIEAYTGVAFRRPLLSRERTMATSTSSHVKSLEYHMNLMFDVLQQDYPALKQPENRVTVAASQIIHIDDREDILWEGSAKLVNCPEYSYTPFMDITAGIDRFILEQPDVQEYLKTNERDNAFVEPSPPLSTPDERNMLYHLFLAEKYRALVDNNRLQLQDNFFPRFVRALKAFKTLKRPFTDRNVKKLNELITAGAAHK